MFNVGRDDASSTPIILRLTEPLARFVGQTLFDVANAGDQEPWAPEVKALSDQLLANVRPTLQVVVYNRFAGQWRDPLQVSGTIHAFLKAQVSREAATAFIAQVMDSSAQNALDIVKLARQFANVVPARILDANSLEIEDVPSWLEVSGDIPA